MRTRLAPAPLVLASLLVLSSPLAGQSVGPAVAPAFLVDEAQEAPPRVTPRRLAAPLARLSAAAVGARDQLAALEAWNAAGRRPPKNGFRRALPLPRTVRLGAGSMGSAADGALSGGGVSRVAGAVVWGPRVEVDGAYRLRLHLTGVELPAAARLWVWSDAETRGPFGRELVGPGGDLWTPSVAGGAIWIEVEIPAADLAARSYGFTVAGVLEIVGGGLAPRLQAPLPGAWSCMQDGTCILLPASPRSRRSATPSRASSSSPATTASSAPAASSTTPPPTSSPTSSPPTTASRPRRSRRRSRPSGTTTTAAASPTPPTARSCGRARGRRSWRRPSRATSPSSASARSRPAAPSSAGRRTPPP